MCALITFIYFGIHIVGHGPAQAPERAVVAQVHLSAPSGMLPGPAATCKEFVAVDQVVLGPRPASRLRPLDLLGEVRLLRGVLGRGDDRRHRAHAVVPGALHPVPARAGCINVATIIHSDEALLAVGFIFTVHFFNTHFRPEKFPMDTGDLHRPRAARGVQEDRPREYEELVASGKLEESFVPRPCPRGSSAASGSSASARWPSGSSSSGSSCIRSFSPIAETRAARAELRLGCRACASVVDDLEAVAKRMRALIGRLWADDSKLGAEEVAYQAARRPQARDGYPGRGPWPPAEH